MPDEQAEPDETARAVQAAIRWAQHVVVVYPLWLGGPPAVLKAFFDPNFVLRAPVVVDPASNGTALKTLAATLTVEGELNKLAGNLSIGRNLAGVHWRSDAQEGLMLGQAVALSVLQDWKLTYNESPNPISFRGFNGELITA